MLQQDTAPADVPVGEATAGLETTGGWQTAPRRKWRLAGGNGNDDPAGARPLEQAVQAYVERFHLLDSSQLEIHHQALREGPSRWSMCRIWPTRCGKSAT
jgi:hypothetical protein